MSKTLFFVCVGLLVALVGVILLWPSSTKPAAATVPAMHGNGKVSKGCVAQLIGTSTFPDVPLASMESFIKNDRGILLGGVGSDLWHGPGEAANRFWMISDRGPNGAIEVDGKDRRTFCVPEFSPVILHVELDGDKIKILKTIPLVDPAGAPVGGISNIKGADEAPFDYRGEKPIPYDPNGLDCEGLVRTADGGFWISEEYSPSLVRCDAEGKIVKRYVPVGLKLEKTRYPVVACLPNILTQRKKNRGFEGLAISRDEKTLYAVMQSALYNPNKKVGSASRNVRVIAFDITSEKPVAEYVYRVEPFPVYGLGAKKMSDVKISGLAMLDDTHLLVLERTDKVARLYRVDLSGADNLLDSKWDRRSTSPSLEAIDDLSSVGVKPLPKTLVVNLGSVSGLPMKIEGIAVLDPRTIAITNDNDFDLGSFNSAGKNEGAGTKTVICILRLEAPLVLEK